MDNIAFNRPYLTGKEREYLEDVFRQERFYGTGKYTARCAELIAARTGAKNVLLTDSCTSALEISALLLRDWGAEQEVILPSYTFSSTASAFARAGFKLVFAEIDPRTMMLDPEDVAARITERTSAVVAVHYGGLPAQIERLAQLCAERELTLVEDAAQAYDCHLDGKALGTFGTFGCFSFHETKNLHAGLAGALLVNDSAFAARAAYVWERGTNRQEVLKGLVDKYSWVEIGGSFYPTELQAAFLCAQLEAADENKAERETIFAAYRTALLPLRDKGLCWFNDPPPGYSPNFHAFYVVFDSEAECDRVREGLSAQGIAAYIGYVPLHSAPVGLSMGYSPESLPVTEDVAKRVLRLPFHNRMNADDATRVGQVISGILCG